jgi:alkaline phosphatase
MSYRLDAPGKKEPTLVEMARQALNILKKNQNGFVLLIEG